MGRLSVYVVFFTVLSSFALAQISSRMNIEETDGSPSVFPWKLKVSTGSLTDNGDGTATLSTGGGGGGDFAPSSGSPNYIHNRETLQVGATFYVSSGTVGGLTARTSSVTVTSNLVISTTVFLGSDPGTSGQVLTSSGPGQVPVWTTPSGGGGGASGQINNASTYAAPYYSVAGSSNVLSGSSIMEINPSSISITGSLGFINTYGITTGSATINDLTASQLVRTDANKKLISSATLTTTELTGVLQAAQEPAHTGDVTNTAGSLAMTAAAIQGNIKTFTSSITVTGIGGLLVSQGVSAASGTFSDLSASQMVRTDANKKLISSATLTTTELAGPIQAANFPALTGDVTTTAGSLATTAAAVQNNIKTFGSSITVVGSGGLGVTYGVSAASITVSTNSYIAGSTFTHKNGGLLSVSQINWADGTVQVSSPPAGGGSGTPGGSDTQVQYNNGGSFGGASFFNIHASSASTTADTVWTTSSVGPVLTDANSCTWRTGVTTSGNLVTTLISCPSAPASAGCGSPVGILLSITKC